MSFLSWHYTYGLTFYFQRYIFSLKWLNHYFSLYQLLASCFAPWKKLVDTETRSGFNPLKSLEKISFNLISRSIGAVVRLVFFAVGIFVILVVSIAGLFGFVFWLIIPMLSYSTYKKYKSHPNIIANELALNMQHKHPIQVLKDSYAGQFLLSHMGGDPDIMAKGAQTVNVDWERTSVNNFRHLIQILLDQGMWNDQFLRSQNMKREDILEAAAWWDKKMTDESYINDDPSLGRPGLALELLYGYTPNLNKVATDLGSPRVFSHHLIGRQNVVNRMERSLANGQNIILTGPPGVGKHTVVLEFAHRASRGELGKKLSYQRVLELDYSTLLSGSEDIAGKKTLFSQLLAEAAYAGNVILVIRDLHRLTSQEIEGIDFSDTIEDYVRKGGLRIISTISEVDYERFLSRNMRLRKYFETISVQQPTSSEAFEILVDAATDWEETSGIVFTTRALRMIQTGSDKYITEAPYPEKCLELLDAAVSYAQSKSSKSVTIGDIKVILAEKTGISFNSLNDERRAQLSKLEEVIHERLINQETPVSLISKILRSKTMGVVQNKRPLGSFLFLGPTGVGKTETAKVLSRVYFGSEEKMIRFNMAEYAGREGLERLIGSADRNLPGMLTNSIARNPSCLLLLDEIEKAPPEVHNLLLALLDEGEIVDAFDRTFKAQNIFVIATSNAGAEQVRQLIQQGISGEKLQRLTVDNVMQQQIFSPELINRFDGVVVYEPLSPEHLTRVAGILVNELANNLKEKDIDIVFSEDAVKKIAEEGYEPAFGARPMRRLIELQIGDVIGRAMLSNEINPGSQITVLPAEGKNAYTWRSS